MKTQYASGTTVPEVLFIGIMQNFKLKAVFLDL